MGRPDDAESMLRAAYEGARRVAGDWHRVTLTAMGRLGRVLADRGRPQDAEELIREALARARQAQGGRAWLVGQLLADLGYVLMVMERFEEAERALLEAETTLGHAVESDRFHVESTLRLLVRLYEQWNKPDVAAAWRSKLSGSDVD